MGGKALESVLEQDALSFTIWTPQPMMSYDGGKVAATFVARIGDGNGSELDIQRIVDTGLSVQNVGMPDWYKRNIRTKCFNIHRLIDQKIPETAWQVAEKALSGGELSGIGLSQRPTILGSNYEDGLILLKAAESISAYRFILENGMISQNDSGIFDVFGIGAKNLKSSNSSAAKYAIISEYEKFPNLRNLYKNIDKPFEVAAKFRASYTAKRFREWLSSSVGTDSDVDIIRDYINACGNRKGIFESAPDKFFKLTGMVAIGHLLIPGAHLLGEAAGAILSGVPAEALGALGETASEVGLGVIDSFVIDNLKVGWTPRAYFDRLRRFQHRTAPKAVR